MLNSSEILLKLIKRGNDSRPFVAFVEDIFMGEGIANTIDNIDDYRTYKKKLYREFEK